jgi:23S rRNA maturation mini-RNase III
VNKEREQIMDISKMMNKYNLSFRRIPDRITNTYELRHHKPGNKVIYRHGIAFTQETVIPKNAGMYMTKQVDHNMSTLEWNIKKDFLASSLEKSIGLFLKERSK